MSQEIILKRNYRQLFREAHETNNIHRMAEIFESLCDEIGIPNPGRESMQAAAGRAIAEWINSRNNGAEVKKI